MDQALIDDIFAQEWGRVLAALIGILGDFELAEDAAQEAFVRAAERWPRDGVPDAPVAWLAEVSARAWLDAAALALSWALVALSNPAWARALMPETSCVDCQARKASNMASNVDSGAPEVGTAGEAVRGMGVVIGMGGYVGRPSISKRTEDRLTASRATSADLRMPNSRLCS